MFLHCRNSVVEKLLLCVSQGKKKGVGPSFVDLNATLKNRFKFEPLRGMLDMFIHQNRRTVLNVDFSTPSWYSKKLREGAKVPHHQLNVPVQPHHQDVRCLPRPVDVGCHNPESSIDLMKSWSRNHPLHQHSRCDYFFSSTGYKAT